MAEYHNVFPKATLSLNEKSMVQGKRLAITTAVGILTGLYCAGSLLIAASPGTLSFRNSVACRMDSAAATMLSRCSAARVLGVIGTQENDLP